MIVARTGTPRGRILLCAAPHRDITPATASRMSDSHRPSSRLPGFYRLSQDERRAALVEAGWMTSEAAAHYASTGGALPADVADSMIENVIAHFQWFLNAEHVVFLSGANRDPVS